MENSGSIIPRFNKNGFIYYTWEREYPLTIEEKILELMSDNTKNAYQILEDIRYVIESSKK